MAHSDAREGKWRGNWRMEWVASPVLFTLTWNMVYLALLSLMRTPRLPVVDWTDAPADLNGLVRFAERRNLVSVRVPSHFKRILLFRSPVMCSGEVNVQIWCCSHAILLLKEVLSAVAVTMWLNYSSCLWGSHGSLYSTRNRHGAYTSKLWYSAHGNLWRDIACYAVFLNNIAQNNQGKGKVYPRTGHEGPEVEYRYSYTLSLTLELDGGLWSTPRPAALPPGKTRYPLYRRLDRPQGRYGQVRKISPPTRIRSPDRPARSDSLYRLSYPGPFQRIIFRFTTTLL